MAVGGHSEHLGKQWRHHASTRATPTKSNDEYILFRALRSPMRSSTYHRRRRPLFRDQLAGYHQRRDIPSLVSDLSLAGTCVPCTARPTCASQLFIYALIGEVSATSTRTSSPDSSSTTSSVGYINYTGLGALRSNYESSTTTTSSLNHIDYFDYRARQLLHLRSIIENTC